MVELMTEAEGTPTFKIIHSGRLFEAGDVSEVVVDDPASVGQLTITISERGKVLVRYRDPKKMHEKTRGV